MHVRHTADSQTVYYTYRYSVHVVRKQKQNEPFEIGIVILQSVSEWQRDKVDWSGINVDFSTLSGCHGNVP